MHGTLETSSISTLQDRGQFVGWPNRIYDVLPAAVWLRETSCTAINGTIRYDFNTD